MSLLLLFRNFLQTTGNAKRQGGSNSIEIDRPYLGNRFGYVDPALRFAWLEGYCDFTEDVPLNAVRAGYRDAKHVFLVGDQQTLDDGALVIDKPYLAELAGYRDGKLVYLVKTKQCDPRYPLGCCPGRGLPAAIEGNLIGSDSHDTAFTLNFEAASLSWKSGNILDFVCGPIDLNMNDFPGIYNYRWQFTDTYYYWFWFSATTCAKGYNQFRNRVGTMTRTRLSDGQVTVTDIGFANQLAGGLAVWGDYRVCAEMVCSPFYRKGFLPTPVPLAPFTPLTECPTYSLSFGSLVETRNGQETASGCDGLTGTGGASGQYIEIFEP